MLLLFGTDVVLALCCASRTGEGIDENLFKELSARYLRTNCRFCMIMTSNMLCFRDPSVPTHSHDQGVQA